MLQEIASTHRNNLAKSKRWFTDSNMDLFVWFKNKRPVSFQLAYIKEQQEYSINWHINNGYTHNLIKAELRHIKYRKSSIHSSECKFDTAFTARMFLLASNNIETTLADFIFARLMAYPGQLEIHSNLAIVSVNL
ncbi:MAG: hypothetical protein OEY06_07740 [Gammaproteobacteria bacterium]|nr:hypothetical protein [Gammaproteobacteria bacterium]